MEKQLSVNIAVTHNFNIWLSTLILQSISMQLWKQLEKTHASYPQRRLDYYKKTAFQLLKIIRKVYMESIVVTLN